MHNIVSFNVVIQAIINGLALGGLYALLATGLTLAFGVMGVANSAHASFAILGSFISFWLLTLYGISPVFSIFVSFGSYTCSEVEICSAVKPLRSSAACC